MTIEKAAKQARAELIAWDIREDVRIAIQQDDESIIMGLELLMESVDMLAVRMGQLQSKTEAQIAALRGKNGTNK